MRQGERREKKEVCELGRKNGPDLDLGSYQLIQHASELDSFCNIL